MNKIIFEMYGVIVGLLLAIAIILIIPLTGEKKSDKNIAGLNPRKEIVVLNATSTTGTSNNIEAGGAKRITLQLSRDTTGATTTITNTFTVKVSVDGTNYISYNKLVDNVTNAITQNLTRVASKSFTATGTAVYSFDLQHDYIKYFNITNTQSNVNDGFATTTASAFAIIEY